MGAIACLCLLLNCPHTIREIAWRRWILMNMDERFMSQVVRFLLTIWLIALTYQLFVVPLDLGLLLLRA
jgi:hypothetical protein